MAEKNYKESGVLVSNKLCSYSIPENWIWTNLEHVAKWSSGGTPKSTSKEYYNGEIPWLIIGDLNDGKVVDSEKKITQKGLENSSAKIVEVGSVLVAMYGSIGKLGINSMKCTTNQAIAFTKEIYDITTNKYLFYYLLNVRSKLINLGKGGTQQNISQTVLKTVEIPLPPVAEQQRIVNRIESLFEKIDKAQELIEEVREGFEKRKEAILAKVFRGELTAKWREENALNFDDWETGAIKNYITKINQGWSPKCESFPSKNTNDWGVIKTTAIQHMIFDESENKQLPISLEPRLQHELKSGDILITRAGPRVRVGVCCLIKDVRPKLLLCDKAYRFNAITEKILPEYLMMVMNSPEKLNEINGMKTGISDSGVNITQDRFLSIEIQVPSIGEQQKIVEVLNNIFEDESRISEIIKMSNNIESIKKSILAKAFRGELGTNDLTEESVISLIT